MPSNLGMPMEDKEVLIGVLVAVAIAVLVCASLLCFVQRQIFKPLADRETGEQRRALWPPEVDWPTMMPFDPPAEDVQITRELYKLRDGSKLFFIVATPLHRPITKVVMMLHGYGQNNNVLRVSIKALAIQFGFAVVCPDLPAHGRSDGRLTYVPDWFDFCGKVWEIVDERLAPLVAIWSMRSGHPLRVYLLGESMGGAVAATLAMQRQLTFDGVILVAPMLYVSDNLKPSRITVTLFRYLALPLFPKWPIAPAKNIGEFTYRTKGVSKGMSGNNALAYHCKGRLATAFELGFKFPKYFSQNIHKFTTPFLVLHGDADLVTDPAMSKRLFEEAPVKDKMLKMYPGAYHAELLHPGVQEEYAHTLFQEVLRDIDEWTSRSAAQVQHSVAASDHATAQDIRQVSEAYIGPIYGEPKTADPQLTHLSWLSGVGQRSVHVAGATSDSSTMGLLEDDPPNSVLPGTVSDGA